MEKKEWMKLITDVIKQSNNNKHSTIMISPNEAIKGNDNLYIWKKLLDNAKFNRKYGELSKGDGVRVAVKKKAIHKGFHPKYSEDVYKVLAVKNGDYLINNNTRRLYRRHDLLKA